jgi:hypothetical protein
LPSEILTPATLGEPELGRYRVRHPSFASGRLAATLVLALLALTLSGAHSTAQVATLPVTAGIAVVTSFSGIDPSTSNPPDLTIAAGLDRLVIVVVIRDKNGALVASEDLRVFFASVRAAGEDTVFSPRSCSIRTAKGSS